MPDVTNWEAAARLGLATGLAGAIGLERELNAQQAGFRTHVLVGLGAALFTVAGADVVGTDPTRVAAQVVTGIGFLGAGAILRDGNRIKGLTTAASLFVTAAAGVACGLGALMDAMVAIAIALVVLVVLKRVERDVFSRRHGHQVELQLTTGADLTDVVAHAQQQLGGTVEVRAVGALPDGGVRVTLQADVLRHEFLELAVRLRELPGVAGVELAR